jgi:hypothetical protein
MINIVESERPISENDLMRIEKAIDGPLPEQYRAFLLKHNGGRPEPDTIDIDGWVFRSTDVRVFYAIDDSAESCDILLALDRLEGCKENKLLPIAGDSFADNFILVIAEDGYGEVVFFDPREIPPRPYLVANDFNEFLSKLHEPRPDQLPDND